LGGARSSETWVAGVYGNLDGTTERRGDRRGGAAWYSIILLTPRGLQTTDGEKGNISVYLGMHRFLRTVQFRGGKKNNIVL